MIYVAEVDVPFHENWGDIHSVETILPSNIHHITAVWSNVVPKEGSNLKRYIDVVNNVETVGNILNAQIGSISAVLNTTDILLDGSPLCELARLDKSSINANKILLADGGIDVDYGTSLRVIVEEMEECPYVLDATEWAKYPDYKSGVELNSNYVAKLYIEYDR